MAAPNSLKITRDPDTEPHEFELPKRFHVPGVVLSSTCPKCGTEWEKDLGSDYLSYPVPNKPFKVTAWCSHENDEGHECGEEWLAGHITLKIDVEIVESPVTTTKARR